MLYKLKSQIFPSLYKALESLQTQLEYLHRDSVFNAGFLNILYFAFKLRYIEQSKEEQLIFNVNYKILKMLFYRYLLEFFVCFLM